MNTCGCCQGLPLRGSPGAAGTRFVSEQGTRMGRRSFLHVHIRGERGAEGIDVGGYVTPLVEAVMTLCNGQIADCSREDGDQISFDREAYYRTIEAKTAALFVLACHTGAIIGGASLEAAEALRRYGRSLGLAFQIVDDILDLVGDEAELGKPVGSDLRQGTVTLPLIFLRDEVPSSLVSEAFGSDGQREEAIQEIAARARGSRAIERSYEEARKCADEAVSALHFTPPGDVRDLLVDLSRTVVDRQS